MVAPILATKLYVPPPRPKVVLRSHLIDRLNGGLAMGCKLTLISAAAGFCPDHAALKTVHKTRYRTTYLTKRSDVKARFG